MIVLQTRGLKKVYGTGEARVRALDGVDLDVEQGEFVAVVGTSGSGKSTLLHMLGGLDRPTAGTVTVDGRNIFALSDEALTVFRRRKIGFVFQAYNLVPVLSVWENIVLPVQLDGRRPDKAYLAQVVEALGLAEKLDRLPGQLSGGMLQRAMVAAAIISEPKLLICDEPTTALDVTIQEGILNLLKKINREKGTGILFISHNLHVVRKLCTRVAVMCKGQLLEEGPVDQVFFHPQADYTKGLIAAIPTRRKRG